MTKKTLSRPTTSISTLVPTGMKWWRVFWWLLFWFSKSDLFIFLSPSYPIIMSDTTNISTKQHFFFPFVIPFLLLYFFPYSIFEGKLNHYNEDTTGSIEPGSSRFLFPLSFHGLASLHKTTSCQELRYFLLSFSLFPLLFFYVCFLLQDALHGQENQMAGCRSWDISCSCIIITWLLFLLCLYMKSMPKKTAHLLEWFWTNTRKRRKEKKKYAGR